MEKSTQRIDNALPKSSVFEAQKIGKIENTLGKSYRKTGTNG